MRLARAYPVEIGQMRRNYWIELPTCENTVLALLPIRRTVPITITRITANITAYSATSCPSSSCKNFASRSATSESPLARARLKKSCKAPAFTKQDNLCTFATQWPSSDSAWHKSAMPTALVLTMTLYQEMVTRGRAWFTANNANSSLVETPNLSKILLR